MIFLLLVTMLAGDTRSISGDRDAVRTVVERFESAWNDGDIDGLLEAYTDPHVDVNDPAQTLTRAETRARLAALRPGTIFRITITSMEIVVEGDLAFQRGEFVLTPAGAAGTGGETTTTKRYIEILRREEGGEWRVWWSMDGPIARDGGE